MKSKLVRDINSLAEKIDWCIDNGVLGKDYKPLNKSLKEVVAIIDSEVQGDTAALLIRNALEKYGITQKQIAEKVGNTRQNINQMLDRTRLGMRCDSFQKIVSAMGCDIILRRKYENS